MSETAMTETTMTAGRPDAAARAGQSLGERPFAERLRAEVEAGLAALDLPAEPASLYGPVRYALSSGGKRLRPVALLLAAEAFGGAEARRRAHPAALAIETFHNFTLVHDDIMDRAETRRGRPCVHTRWGEAEAILAGDLMHGLSVRLLGQAEFDGAERGAQARALFDRMVVRLCEGQALDLAFETQADVSVEAYLAMIDAKTGALLDLALELGALVGGADAAALAAMRRAGHALGRAFQIQDDLLDLTADHADWGKTIGGDLVAGKRTFLLLRAVERAAGDPAEAAWWARAFGGLPEADVAEARARMSRLGVLAEAEAAVSGYVATGTDALAALPDGDAADALRALALALVGRAV
ncbi:MAG TPA: polyprenyl synthetase family protein [Rubricoccaceae bacterium]|jgi:geranylgeranyl diphosphate synthase type II